MNYVKPSGYDLKTPSGYQPSDEILEKSERNANGKLIRELIAPKVKIALSWNVMTAEEMQVLATIRKLGSFDCEYLDLETNSYLTKTFYCAPIQCTPKKTGNGMVTLWGDITTSFVEL